jgi:hypothetical protein
LGAQVQRQFQRPFQCIDHDHNSGAFIANFLNASVARQPAG